MSIERQLTLNLLRAFIAVAETGQITLAAERMCLTQSAVSQQIKKLESLLEVHLFERAGEVMRLTDHGERLMTRAYHLLAAMDELISDMHKSEQEEVITLGVPSDIIASLLPPVLSHFKQQYPNVAVTLVGDKTYKLHADLDQGKLDIVLLTESYSRINETLLEDRLVWVGNVGTELAESDPLPVALGDHTCAFRQATTHAFNEKGISWRAVCQIGSLEPVVASIKSDMALGVFLESAVPEGLSVIEHKRLPSLPSFFINIKVGGNKHKAHIKVLVDHLSRLSSFI